MISNNQTKLILSLQQKKNRDKLLLYLIEGDKIILEHLEFGRQVKLVAGTKNWIDSVPKQLLKRAESNVELTDRELKHLSSLSTPHNAIAIVKKQAKNIDNLKQNSGLTLALDFIQDPSNMGSIIRSAAWFDIKNIVCSNNCVDMYNPKVIQASMGATLVTNVYYTKLSSYLIDTLEKGIEIYATTLDGESIYEADLKSNAVILFGNESRGISADILPYISKKLLIPPGTSPRPIIDSLNVSTSVAVICSEFERRFA